MSEPQSPRHCMLYSSDLFFVSKIVGTARSLGIQIETSGQMGTPVNFQPVGCLLIDLSLQNLQLDQLLSELPTAQKPRVIAFGSHVQSDKLQAARASGCDLVITKNQLTSRLPELLQQYCSGSLKTT